MSDYSTNDSNTGLWILGVGGVAVAVIAALYLISGSGDAGSDLASPAVAAEEAAPATTE